MSKNVAILLVLCTFLPGIVPSEIPSYIEVCKRDQSTINACVKHSIENLRPYLVAGIPELNVPPLEPFYIPELIVDEGNLVQFKAVGKDVKVTGAGNFTIKNIAVDLDTLTIRGRIKIPRLHFEGKYFLDARLLVLPLKGEGDIIADATKCEAEVTMHGRFVERDGVEYAKFTDMNMDITVRDYHVQMRGLFNGNPTLEEAANQALNENRAELLRASKPYVERTCSKLLLSTANKIASTFPIDQLLPNP